jgi:hypothetical protein
MIAANNEKPEVIAIADDADEDVQLRASRERAEEVTDKNRRLGRALFSIFCAHAVKDGQRTSRREVAILRAFPPPQIRRQVVKKVVRKVV